MEIALYFFGIALLVASVFLMLDAQQSRRFNKITRETGKVQPLFLQRAVEQKLNTLNSFLYENSTGESMLTPARLPLNDNTRETLSAQLSRVNNERNTGKISLQAYNVRLNDLLDKARRGQ